jgi:hypothetical protein
MWSRRKRKRSSKRRKSCMRMKKKRVKRSSMSSRINVPRRTLSHPGNALLETSRQKILLLAIPSKSLVPRHRRSVLEQTRIVLLTTERDVESLWCQSLRLANENDRRKSWTLATTLRPGVIPYKSDCVLRSHRRTPTQRLAHSVSRLLWWIAQTAIAGRALLTLGMGILAV